ncbi:MULTISPECIES: MarR family winged helix-turn-helix transcriptional regulator [Listeria]|uniref:MarR family winged helix-turn-helix transcriptional regulator n=1 Tax=Listeria TaxID=1637 RepID=UPI000B596688|nr:MULTISPECIES: MarR family transcriptional regulator [Listeria]
MHTLNHIGYLLMKTAKELRYDLSSSLEKYGITSAQWAVLKQLEWGSENEKLRLKQTSSFLADELGFDKPTMSGIVSRLEKNGWVTRTEHPMDRRATILTLTKKAHNNLPFFEKKSEEVMKQFLRPYSEEEKYALLQLLEKQIKRGDHDD